MSSSSLSSPTPPSSDESNVGGTWATYRERQALFKHCQDCWQAEARCRVSSSAAGPSRMVLEIVMRCWPAQSVLVLPVCPPWPPLAPGVFHPVPEAHQVAQVDVMPDQFALVVGCPQGLPTLAWCRHHGPGWTLEWVQEQMEEDSRSRAAMAATGREGEGGQSKSEESSKSEEEEPAPTAVIRVGPPHGRQRPLMVARGKRQASSSPEADPSKRPQGDALLAGPPGPHVFLPTSACPQPPPQETLEQSLLASTMELCRHLQEAYKQSEQRWGKLMAATMDRDRAWRDQDIALAAVREREVELTALRAQVAELELKVVREMPDARGGAGGGGGAGSRARVGSAAGLGIVGGGIVLGGGPTLGPGAPAAPGWHVSGPSAALGGCGLGAL
ncbi:hypothetical protein C0993_000805 [Termitomyces sp. T159_Od127]|nr:hypothetical protein C0993_000805 [Termitomyces sp. T159_Od127]